MTPIVENLITDKQFIIKSVDKKDAINRIAENLTDLILSHPKKFETILILCIGTDRSTGDSLGPLVGTFLDKKRKIKKVCRVLGCLDYPVHIKNLDWFLKTLHNENALLIAIDAALGKDEHIGQIHMFQGGLTPGSGVGKKFREVGDISIYGIVNISTETMGTSVLQNTRLSLVYRMASVIADAINKALVDLIDMKSNNNNKAVLKVT